MGVHPDDHPPVLSPFAGAGLVTLGCAAIVAASIALQGAATALTKETGGVELASVTTLVVLAVWMLLRWRDLGSFWMLPLLLVLMALRERDLHDWFYEPGLLHAGVLRGDNPVWQKLVTGGLILGILALLALVLWRGAAPFARGLWQRMAWAWVLLAGGVCAVLSLTLDGAARKLAPVGITIGPDLDRALGQVEELAELGLSLALVWAVAAFMNRAPRG